MVKLAACLLLVIVIASCGGGGSGGGGSTSPTTPPQPPASEEPPFGLDERPPLADFNLPTEPVAGGELGLERRYPALSFPSALFISPVPGEPRLVVVRQSGTLEAFEDDNASSEAKVVLDLSERILFAGEQGLLGLAFDPDFVSNRFLYVHYSMNNPRRSVIARFSWEPGSDEVDPDSEKIILEVEQPFANHNGGMLAFGPDDMLYIALGDGGSGGDPQNNAQNTQNLLGTILRIDVHPAEPGLPYSIPLDNPFTQNPTILDEIWAFGLRNPFRFSFDRETGKLWLGDVGQRTLEEIDIATGGENFGWRVYEGTMPFDDSENSLPDSNFTPPIYEYGRDQGVAIIGGYVYRGNDIAALAGRYVYTDFGSGNIWALTYDGGKVVGNELIARAESPTSLGEDANGELIVVSRQGELYGFTESGGGNAPDLLSETGLFTDLRNLVVASGLIEYTVNHAFWSDNALKRRWIAVPEAEVIDFEDTEAWNFPVGTITVKHFEMLTIEGNPASAVRLETRVMTRLREGWEAFTYRWNAQGTDATLLSGRQTQILQIQTAAGEQVEQVYSYPSRTDCFRCHTAAADRVLGLNTRQINTEFDYGDVIDNQLRSWNHIGLFRQDIGDDQQYPAYPGIDDATASPDERARTYLDVNCAQCHQPGGTTPVDIDLRFDTPIEQMGIINEVPLAGSLGIEDARIVLPGQPGRSIVIARTSLRDGAAMPPLASHLVDQAGVELLSAWVEAQ